MSQEIWQTIPEFANYDISNFGRVYNHRTNSIMRNSRTHHGNVKITLRSDWSQERYTRSVAQLVAEAFVLPPDPLCDYVVALDGNLGNVAADNLAWRPRGFAWNYIRQLRAPQPMHYRNLSVMNLGTGFEYDSIIEAGMTEGLLFRDIWRSTWSKNFVYPSGCVFEITERIEDAQSR